MNPHFNDLISSASTGTRPMYSFWWSPNPKIAKEIYRPASTETLNRVINESKKVNNISGNNLKHGEIRHETDVKTPLIEADSVAALAGVPASTIAEWSMPTTNATFSESKNAQDELLTSGITSV